MAEAVSIASLAGLWLLWSRWPKSLQPERLAPPASGWPKVSIVVPARNEALTLPTLLGSLRRLEYPDFEVIVVDDASTDDTAEMALRHGDERVRVVTARPRPTGWRGKQWACAEGALAACGEILVFTDADTEHEPDSLQLAVDTLAATGRGMISALPYHSGASLWERLLGPFHALMLTVTRPLGKQCRGRTYAIGQYLAFDRNAYSAVGGHASVRDEIVEDIPLAEICLSMGIPYGVAPSTLFRVRMYRSLKEFIAGWRRNVRAGLRSSTILAPVEITLAIFALSGGGFPGWLGVATAGFAIALVIRAQRRLGNFSVAGGFLWPFAVGLFTLVTLLACFDMLARRPVFWKGRAYPVS